LPPVPKSSSGFSLKNAGRTLSWGRNKNTPFPSKEYLSNSKELPSPPEEEPPTGRPRTVTASSYASTATPPKLDERDLGLSLGGDFSEMFAGFGKRKSVVLEVQNNRAMSQSPVSPCSGPKLFSASLTHKQEILPSGPANNYTSNRHNQPSPLNIDRKKEVETSPYSWSSQHSRDGLMSSSSPPPFAPRHNETPPPPVPQHGQSRVNNDNSSYGRQRPGGVVEGLRRTSALSARRQSTPDYGEAVDEDANLLRESINASRKLNEPNYSSRVRDSWALPSTSAYKIDDSAVSSWRTGSVETTPRAKKVEPRVNEDNMFDTQIAYSANIAQQFQEKSLSPPSRNAANNKVMTPAQFERYRQDQERLRSVGGQSKDDDDEEEDETYEDDEDETEKNRQLAKQRRKQEAHMAVYRQQMMKVTGEQASTNARPSVFATQSSPNLVAGGQVEDAEEEDEEVPLAILQAHGFPSKSKPPMRSMGSNPNLRSSAQSLVGGADPRLPVFARNLPQDPYFGAGIVNPMHRESLAFGGGTGSVTGGPSRSLPPGGLVGVIATEERSRAMRRGSPNPQGEYPAVPSNGSNGLGGMPSTAGSLYNGMGPSTPMMGPVGPINPMMMTPGDQAQMQMSQQMQQFMQMQMQFMQMMTAGGQGLPQQNGHMPHNSTGEIPRPGSVHQLRPASSHQRAMTMMEPNAAPWMQNRMYPPQVHFQGNGYAPSIAPSERSNIGLPGRYRPVSHMPVSDVKTRTSTMSGALQDWENKNGSSTIKPIKKTGSASDEDDEEGWEEMAKKREKKKSLWRTKKDKDPNGLKEILGFGQ
jgi:hypothetical protein